MDLGKEKPRRFSHQLQLMNLRHGLALAQGGIDAEVLHQESTRNDIRTRSHHSAPNLPVNQPGKFNSNLQRTGFLGETKMRAKRIAQNPKRFLEAYANSRENPAKEQEFVPTELPDLEHFIQKLALDDRFEVKEAVMKKRTESAKFRTFLLAMTSTSSMEVDPKTLAFLQSWSSGDETKLSSGGGDKSKIYEDAVAMEDLVTNYLNQIRAVDTTAIQAWVNEFLDLGDMELPYGLCTNIPNELPIDSGFGDSKEIASFIESAQDNFLLLDAEFHTKIEEITKELATIFNIMQQEWTSEESSLLFYVMNSFTTSGTESTLILPLQLELMHRLFPGKSNNEITKQKFRLKTKKSLEEKRGAVIRAWLHDKAELQFKMDVAWKEVSTKRIAELERKLSIKKQKDICEFWAERLQKLRKEKCEQVRKLKILIEPLEKYRENKTKTIVQSEAQRREAAKAELKKYQLQKLEEEEAAVNRMEAEREIEEIAQKQRAGTNKRRVSYRQNQRKLKEKAKRNLEAAIEEQRRQRQIQLEQTKEVVSIDYDPSNVVADTHASMVRRFSTLRDQKKIEDERMASVFRDCYSFSEETVLKDRRLRFEVKLKEAGLLDSAYARQVLMAMEPKPKPHLQSQVKLSHDDQ